MEAGQLRCALLKLRSPARSLAGSPRSRSWIRSRASRPVLRVARSFLAPSADQFLTSPRTLLTDGDPPRPRARWSRGTLPSSNLVPPDYLPREGSPSQRAQVNGDRQAL
jgi:hypothetical protein